MHPNSK